MLSNESKEFLANHFHDNSPDDNKYSVDVFTTDDGLSIEWKSDLCKGMEIFIYLDIDKHISKEDYESNPVIKELFINIPYEEFIDRITNL